MPDSHNAGDFGSALVGAPHEYAVTAEQLELRTDGHMDIDAVRPGQSLLRRSKYPAREFILATCTRCRVDGEIAGHTMDVSGTVTAAGRPLERIELWKDRYYFLCLRTYRPLPDHWTRQK